MKKYSRGLDLLLAAALKLRARDFQGASTHMLEFADASDFDEQFDGLMDINDQAFDASDEDLESVDLTEDTGEEELSDEDLDETESDELEEDADEEGIEADDSEELMDDGDESEEEDLDDEEDLESDEGTEETDEDSEDEAEQFASVLERASAHRSRSLNRQVASDEGKPSVEDRRRQRAMANLQALQKN